jgi:hypothetical protein
LGPNYEEVDDEIAEKDGEPHEVDDEGKIKLGGDAASALVPGCNYDSCGRRMDAMQLGFSSALRT